MDIIQCSNKDFNHALINMSLRHDEEIACENATVITDKEGNVTGWIDNSKYLCFITQNED